MANRKNAEQIKQDILSKLKEGPSSIKKLSEEVESTWATINTYLDELKNEGQVRELLSGSNLRIFVRTDYPVFYGLPLDIEKRNNCIFLLSKIIEFWKEKNDNEIPSKTTIQKIAVEIANRNPQFNLPIVRFHYGRVLPVIVEPTNISQIVNEYVLKKPSNYKEFEKEIKLEIGIDKGHTNIAWIERKKQYEKHKDMKIFQIKETLSYKFYKQNLSEDILNLFYDLFMEIPTKDRYSRIFRKYQDFISSVNFIFSTKEFQESNEDKKSRYISEIFDSFNSIWQELTTEFFFEDIEPSLINEEEKTPELVKESKISSCSSETDEKLNNLMEYKRSLHYLSKKLNGDEKQIMEILLEGANEE